MTEPAGGDCVVGDGSTSTGFTRLENVAVGVLYLIFCAVGVTTNLLTAWTFYKDARLLKGSKPWIHICLALANVAVVAPSPLPASSSFSGRWLYGETMCQLYAFEGMVVGLVAIGSVIALCVERCYMASPASNSGAGSWFYVWSVLLVVGNALFWGTMPLLGWSRYAKELTGTSCAIDWRHPDESFTSYMVTLMIFSFLLPTVLALVSLCAANPPDQSDQTSGSQIQEEPSSSSRVSSFQPGDSFSEQQLKMICYVFLALMLIGWSPFAFLCLAAMLGGSAGLSMLAASIPPLACKLVVSLYPLVYWIVSPRFRAGFSFHFGGVEKKQD